jgi:hypothetical protein
VENTFASPPQHKKTPSTSPPLGARRPHQHHLLSAQVPSSSLPNQSIFCSFNSFRLFEQTNFYVHFKGSPLMASDNPCMPPVELALLQGVEAADACGCRWPVGRREGGRCSVPWGRECSGRGMEWIVVFKLILWILKCSTCKYTHHIYNYLYTRIVPVRCYRQI